MAEKRFYWLKLKEGYFDSPKIKKLRKFAGGDTLTIIYLKMQLFSISNGGIIKFEGIEHTFIEELALKLDEDIENIQLLLAYLESQNLIENNSDQYLLLEANNNIGSEGQSAERKRLFDKRKAEREKQHNVLLSNANVTQEKQNSLSISNSISNNINNKEYNIEQEIFNYWNDKNIIKHRELTDVILKTIQKSLKTYDVEEIKKYIDRYAIVIGDKDYFFNYKWTLIDFLSRKDGIASFTDEGSKWLNYVQETNYQEENENCITAQDEGLSDYE